MSFLGFVTLCFVSEYNSLQSCTGNVLKYFCILSWTMSKQLCGSSWFLESHFASPRMLHFCAVAHIGLCDKRIELVCTLDILLQYYFDKLNFEVVLVTAWVKESCAGDISRREVAWLSTAKRIVWWDSAYWQPHWWNWVAQVLCHCLLVIGRGLSVVVLLIAEPTIYLVFWKPHLLDGE